MNDFDTLHERRTLVESQDNLLTWTRNLSEKAEKYLDNRDKLSAEIKVLEQTISRQNKEIQSLKTVLGTWDDEDKSFEKEEATATSTDDLQKIVQLLTTKLKDPAIQQSVFNFIGKQIFGSSK